MIIVRQKDAKDCGPCALQSIIKYYQGYVSLEKIREDTYTNIQGTTVYHLVKAAKNYGFDAIAKKYLDKKIHDCHFPCIVHIHYDNGLNHFMVLYELTDNKALLMDPVQGKITMSLLEFTKLFTGVVIDLYPKTLIVKFAKSKSVYTLFLEILKCNKSLCISLIIVSILLMLFTIINGLYFKVIYEMFINYKDLKMIKFIIYVFCVIAILKILFEYFRNYYENHISKNIDVGLYKSFLNHVFYLPLKVINSRSSGEILTRINEVANIKEIFSNIFIACFLDSFIAIGTIIVLFIQQKNLAMLLLVIVLLYLSITLLLNNYIYNRLKQNINFQTEANTTIVENVNMINSIKNLNIIQFSLQNIENKIVQLINDNYTFTNFFNKFSLIKNFCIDIGIFIINTYGFYLLYEGKITLASLIVFNSLIYYFIDPLKNIIEIIPKYNYLRASFNKISDFMDIQEEQMGQKGVFINGDIIFKNVEFSYNDYSKIIDNFNLTIYQGEKIMLNGKSGCGKSTICQLLQKNYLPLKGNIYIGEKNILDINIATIRSKIVYVGQKENLFSDTLINNILCYQKMNHQKFAEVCKICLLEQLVDKKAFRYDFGIDINNSNISGGEKQRIILARALYRDSEILILDEALSEVDYDLEQKIIINLKKYYPRKTLIYITHKQHQRLFNRVVTLNE